MCPAQPCKLRFRFRLTETEWPSRWRIFHHWLHRKLPYHHDHNATMQPTTGDQFTTWQPLPVYVRQCPVTRVSLLEMCSFTVRNVSANSLREFLWALLNDMSYLLQPLMDIFKLFETIPYKRTYTVLQTTFEIPPVCDRYSLNDPYHQGPLLLTWTNFHPSMDK